MGPNRQLMTSLTVLAVLMVLLIVDLFSGATPVLDVVVGVGVLVAAFSAYVSYRRDGT